MILPTKFIEEIDTVLRVDIYLLDVLGNYLVGNNDKK